MLQSHDLAAELRTLGELRIQEATSEAEAAAAMRRLGAFNRCDVGLVRFSGVTPWERHPLDELLHVLEGEVELTLLPANGPAQRELLRTGALCVVPKGLWHRQLATKTAAMMFVTSREGNETSEAEDPR